MEGNLIMFKHFMRIITVLLINVADFDNVTVGSTTYAELCETIGIPDDIVVKFEICEYHPCRLR